jgi:quinoprotein glucose dehydrogenase
MLISATDEPSLRPTRRPWVLTTLTIVLALAGLALSLGGTQLVSLGGSAYYLLAGLGLIVTAVLLFLGSPIALLAYAVVVLGTLAWAIYEIGLDWWQLVPRGDVVFILGVLLCLPWTVRALTREAPVARRTAFLCLACSLGLAALVGIAAVATPDGNEWDGELLGAPPAAAAGLPQGEDWPAYGGT